MMSRAPEDRPEAAEVLDFIVVQEKLTKRVKIMQYAATMVSHLLDYYVLFLGISLERIGDFVFSGWVASFELVLVIESYRYRERLLTGLIVVVIVERK